MVHVELEMTSTACDVVKSIGKTICDPFCVRKYGCTDCCHKRAVLMRIRMHGLTGLTGGRTALSEWWSVPIGRKNGTVLAGAVRMRDLGAKRSITAGDLDGMESGNAAGDPRRVRTRRRTSLDVHEAMRAAQGAIIADLPPPNRQRLATLEKTGGFHTRLNRYRDIPFAVPASNRDD